MDGLRPLEGQRLSKDQRVSGRLKTLGGPRLLKVSIVREAQDCGIQQGSVRALDSWRRYGGREGGRKATN